MDELLKIILEIPEETQKIEFKRLCGQKVVSKIIETIVAMTNTDGGWLVFGVSDPEDKSIKGINRVFGIEEDLDLYDAIGRELQKIIPPITGIWEPKLIKEESTGKRVGFLKIPKSTDSFKSINKDVFVRQQKSNKKLSPQEIVELSYAKGFKKADKELVNIDFDLLKTNYFEVWKKERKLPNEELKKLLFNTGLARKSENDDLLPTRAAVLLFAEYPTNLMDTKCAIRVYKYQGVIEKFEAVPNLVGEPKTIEGPIIKLIEDAHEYILGLLESGVEMHSGFVTKYKIPERAVREAITNAVIHRDYFIKRDIEVRIFEDRIDILSPGLFIGNITAGNIGTVRANEYRNDIIVKHLREFPEAPNLDRNEGVQAMRSEMHKSKLYPPVFITYPYFPGRINQYVPKSLLLV
jgi:ATP-dependent DNA helicase RecG